MNLVTGERDFGVDRVLSTNTKFNSAKYVRTVKDSI